MTLSASSALHPAGSTALTAALPAIGDAVSPDGPRPVRSAGCVSYGVRR